MSCLAETLIYLLAVLGIIFTSMTFFEMFFYNGTNNKSYRIFSKNKVGKEKIEVIIKLDNVSDKTEENITKLIKNNELINLREISDVIAIEKSE